MKRWIERCTLVVWLGMSTGCAQMHTLEGDAGPMSDAGLMTDAGPMTPDAGPTPEDAGPPPPPPPPSGPGVVCGANTCRAGEICCDAECGVCGFEGECGGSCG